ncbi:metalloregulator ArsR/SmtB family transcription factor [candidate division WWE3 bacterium]|nr:metalloregulator ArsR/SmtB family transcription factor [candidate division WWE3 bacterium]
MVKLTKVSKAFSDNNRLKILKFLSDGQKNVSQVAENLRVEENLASHHLRVLADLGFLKNKKKGRQVFYRLNERRFVSLVKSISEYPAFRSLIEEALKE